MCSLHPEVGITVGDREEAYVKQAMIGASTEVVGLISLRKMGHLCLTWSVLLPD